MIVTICSEHWKENEYTHQLQWKVYRKDQVMVLKFVF